MTQLLIINKMIKPKLNLLFVPWLLLATIQIPSFINKTNDFGKFLAICSLKNLGYNQVTQDMINLLQTNEHVLLLSKDKLNKFKSYVSTDLIPKKYTENRKIHSENTNEELNPLSTYVRRLSESSILVRDKILAQNMLKLFSSEISPIFVDSEILK